jgi:hypothetical protein
MKRVWILAVSFTLLGCRQKYVQPLPDQPQAILKFRRAYDEVSGVRLSEELDLDGSRAFDFEGDSSEGEVVRIDAITIFPGFHSVEVLTQFTSVANTGATSYQVDHGSCEGTTSLNAKEGATYLVQVNYQNSDFCTVECYQQIAKGNGDFSNERCH